MTSNTSDWRTRNEYLSFVRTSDQKQRLAHFIAGRLVSTDRSILDVGCGTGALLERLVTTSAWLGEARHLDVLDPDEENLKGVALNPLLARWLRQTRLGRAEQLSAPAAYDVVMAVHSLYETYEVGGELILSTTIRRLHESIRSGGRLFLGVPSATGHDIHQLRRRLVTNSDRLLNEITIRCLLQSLDWNVREFTVTAVAPVSPKRSIEMDSLIRFALGGRFLRPLTTDDSRIAKKLIAEAAARQASHGSEAVMLRCDTTMFEITKTSVLHPN